MVATHALGPLEMQVLGLVGDEPQAVATLRDRLAAAGADLAYTTVMTVLVRLHKKGLVARKKDGQRWLYARSRRAEPVSASVLTRVRRALFQGDRTAPIAALLEDETLSVDELRALRQRIDEALERRR